MISDCYLRMATSVRDFTIKKLDEFWGWLPIMQKGTNECNEVGPDLASVKRQLQQMQVSWLVFVLSSEIFVY